MASSSVVRSTPLGLGSRIEEGSVVLTEAEVHSHTQNILLIRDLSVLQKEDLFHIVFLSQKLLR